MAYVDGFVIPVPEKNLKDYQKISQKAGKVWREHGALQYIEAAGDDLNNEFGASFPKTIRVKPGETVVFSFILYKSRAHRDKVNAKVMADPRLKKMMEQSSMPFEMKRMVYGGFKVIVDV
jgi:uncharacterized protein YbaA (DUF1428 family)